MEIKHGQIWETEFVKGFKNKHYVKGVRRITLEHCGDDDCDICNNREDYDVVDTFNGVCCHAHNLDKFLKEATYIGESCVAIEDLFKVKEGA